MVLFTKLAHFDARYVKEQRIAEIGLGWFGVLHGLGVSNNLFCICMAFETSNVESICNEVFRRV